jgi:hypothetical protein
MNISSVTWDRVLRYGQLRSAKRSGRSMERGSDIWKDFAN